MNVIQPGSLGFFLINWDGRKEKIPRVPGTRLNCILQWVEGGGGVWGGGGGREEGQDHPPLY